MTDLRRPGNDQRPRASTLSVRATRWGRPSPFPKRYQGVSRRDLPATATLKFQHFGPLEGGASL